MRFLLRNGDASGARSVLLVQSGTLELAERAAALLREKLPLARITVLLQRDAPRPPELPADLEILVNAGPPRETLARLRERRFDAAFVLWSGSPGFWKLKLAPLLVGAGRVLALNEHLGWFPLTVRDLPSLFRHLAWRSHGLHPGRGLESALAVLTFPGKVVALWLFERRATLAARRRDRDALDWKKPRS